ncbi:MAG TPA: hypothetical protein VMT63_02815 [Bacteroidales bacterium]|nr:hypothetical protein [Bacteroidales bacterium]
MRKTLKIKTSFLLLAWLIIFAHGVIPHNHSDEASCSPCSARHESGTGHNRQGSISTGSLHSDENVCHLLNILFQNFNPDNLCTHFSKEPAQPVNNCSTGKIYIHFSDSLVSSSCGSTALFRAPPLA